MKKCSHCKIDKPLSEFHKKRGTRDGLQHGCKSCKSIYLKEHYRLNKSRYLDSSNRSKIKLRLFIRKFKDRPCLDCGVSYPYYVMDFDHRENKSFTIGSHGKRTSVEMVMKEIKKCDVVCANCHRIRSYGHIAQRDRATVS